MVAHHPFAEIVEHHAFAGSAAKAGFTKDKPKATTKVLNVTENV